MRWNRVIFEYMLNGSFVASEVVGFSKFSMMSADPVSRTYPVPSSTKSKIIRYCERSHSGTQYLAKLLHNVGMDYV